MACILNDEGFGVGNFIPRQGGIDRSRWPCAQPTPRRCRSASYLVDVLVANNSGASSLILNNLGSRNRWLGRELQNAYGRDALGARVAVELDSGRTLWRRIHTDGSYASASDLRLVIGVGQAGIRGVRVRWPSGRVEAWPAPAEGRYTLLREGGGTQQPGDGSR
jgi:hypothetical protein